MSIRSAILKEVRSWGVLGAILSLYWHTSTSTAPLRASKTPSGASKNIRTHPGSQLFSPYKILHIKKSQDHFHPLRRPRGTAREKCSAVGLGASIRLAILKEVRSSGVLGPLPVRATSSLSYLLYLPTFLRFKGPGIR